MSPENFPPAIPPVPGAPPPPPGTEQPPAPTPPAVPPAAPPAVPPAAPPAVPPTPAGPGGPQPASGAPDKYEDFKAPEGMVAQKSLLEAFAPVAKGLNLSQDAAQKLVTFQMEQMKAEETRYAQELAAEKAALPSVIAKDPELGGADAVAKAAIMQRAVTAFDDEKKTLRAFLDSPYTPTSVYLAVARAMLKAGQGLKEDSRTGTGNPGAGGDKSLQDLADQTYPSMKTK